MIDIGGEDAKIIFMQDGRPADLRMNGACAGGTGAFIDQMAILLNVDPTELGELAEKSTRIYPIASRCGVFCKTDVQNLIARNIPREDIAASIFHAVAVQTVVTLAHGNDLKAPVLFCGGPLSFIKALRDAFIDYLKLLPDDVILPEKANLIPATGTAIAAEDKYQAIEGILSKLVVPEFNRKENRECLPPLFSSSAEYEQWRRRLSCTSIEKGSFCSGTVRAYLGVDSGSTTTKVVLLDENGRLLFSHYQNNDGDPIKAVETALKKVMQDNSQASIRISSSCSTGYGEDLIKAAFRLDYGIVETVAHYTAAKKINGNVSFILDIGGQDMKAIFVSDGSIRNIDVNEACSSGCGSFISTFANSLGYSVEDFSRMACFAAAPCDLGTRCTVFMNSKVKQVMREGASVDDISAGLSYSVVKNCLYKVLRLNDVSCLGDNIVVQGGTMRNDSIVRGLESLTGKRVFRCDCPELMGAVGCALYAMANDAGSSVGLHEILANIEFTCSQKQCHGCVNRCPVTVYKFKNSGRYFSGNRCEKFFNNKGSHKKPGKNAYELKRAFLFDRDISLPAPAMTIGIPRCLNIFEEYPFWHTLFSRCNIQVRLSDESDFGHYELAARKVMSDNICFPAKLVHSHIDNLKEHGVDRIFMPLVIFEKSDTQSNNSYNCPIVTGYSQVVKSTHTDDTPLDTPVISFKDMKSLHKQCREYLKQLGVDRKTADNAFIEASEVQKCFEKEVAGMNRELLEQARADGRIVILLAGRPYHADPVIQHKVSEMIAAQGAYVITDDIVRDMDITYSDDNYLSQWSFPNRIVKSAHWVAQQGEDIQFMWLTSFGCGPDAFLSDELKSVLKRSDKNLTILKIDDVNNVGSLKLRVRSLIESLGLKRGYKAMTGDVSHQIAPYRLSDRHKKIIVPFFTPYISPLIPSIMKLTGYDVDVLPISDNESCRWGLKYSNNEVCYPATLIVGDIVKAFRSGKYAPEQTCVAITQTGGQCRASNYLPLIRKALVENGYTGTPVVSVSFGSGISNNQPGFKIKWMKILPVVLNAIIFSDCMAKLYYAAVVREKEAEQADRLRDKYMAAACDSIEKNRPDKLFDILALAVNDFGRICKTIECPRIGIVGEIFLKFHPYAQKHITDWLIGRNIEIVYPSLIDFFLQSFVNMKVNKKERVKKNGVPDFVIDYIYSQIQKHLDKANVICGEFRYFTPFDSIFEKSVLAQKAISLNIQFGEGWLLAGEISSLAQSGVRYIVSLQPFGCIANHIVGKGIENRLKKFYPEMNILSLDFDSSVSEVNITNRLLLLINDIHNPTHGKAI